MSVYVFLLLCHGHFCYYLCFFFFKQKTAYEMRISDWSSDVCSSDLATAMVLRQCDPRGNAVLRGQYRPCGRTVARPKKSSSLPVDESGRGSHMACCWHSPSGSAKAFITAHPRKG